MIEVRMSLRKREIGFHNYCGNNTNHSMFVLNLDIFRQNQKNLVRCTRMVRASDILLQIF